MQIICDECGNSYESPRAAHVCSDAPRIITDKDRLDFLQRIMVDEGKYAGKCILRESTRGRGYRLHETTRNGASTSVRHEIDRMMMEYL